MKRQQFLDVANDIECAMVNATPSPPWKFFFCGRLTQGSLSKKKKSRAMGDLADRLSGRWYTYGIVFGYQSNKNGGGTMLLQLL